MARISPSKKIVRAFSRHLLRSIVILLAIIYIISVAVIMIYENVGFLDATVRLMPSFLGDRGPAEITPTGIASILGLVIYVGVLGVVIGKIAEFFINLALKGGIIMKKVNHKNHIVICGWNYQGPKIIENLLSNDYHERPIVILADMEKTPYSSDEVDFISAIPWKKENLINAGIPKADTAIILTDIKCEKTDNPDGDALMITLAVEALNPDVHTCVQLLSSENREHLENANADEIICLDQVGGNLVVSSALNQGVSRILNELLNFNQGSEFYRCKGSIPEKYVGKSFREIGTELLKEKKILVAIETEKDEDILEKCSDDVIHSSRVGKVMVINPQGTYKLRENDFLFVISEKEPVKP